MKLLRFFVAACVALSLFGVASAQEGGSGKKKLAVTKIEAGKALRDRMKKQNVELSLDTVIEALQGQVQDRLLNTRRFEILERADADALATEAAAGGGSFSFQGADYILTIRIDSFNDRKETRKLASLGKTVMARVIELSAVAKITEVATQKAIASTNFQIAKRDSEQRSESTVERVGEGSDELMIGATREMAQKIAGRATDAIYPARVLFKRDKLITINRNDQSGIRVGQVWEIFVYGDETEDPDTGDMMREEVFVGTAKISRVSPQNSQAEILEDSGIDKGALVRLKTDVSEEEEE